MKRIRLVPATLAVLMMLFQMGCSNDALPTRPTQMEMVGMPVAYDGAESRDEVVASIPSIEKGLGRTLSAAEREAMLEAFDQRHATAVNSVEATAATEYTAYGWSWHQGSGTDLDLWLEYKWNSGGQRQAYQITTPIWGIYWIIQVKYNGRLLNWTWNEGAYQRVTVVVGLALWGPYSTYQQSFLRNYIRVRVS